MKAYPGQSGTGLVLYDAWAVPGVITDMCCLLKFTVHYRQPKEPFVNPVVYLSSVSGFALEAARQVIRPEWNSRLRSTISV